MPIYTFECKCGKVTEEIYHIQDMPDSIKCPECGGAAGRIISPHGAIQTDGDVKWLPSACKTLLKHGEPPLETRSQWKAYLKRNNLIAAG